MGAGGVLGTVAQFQEDLEELKVRMNHSLRSTVLENLESLLKASHIPL
jgi:hypothetical protein